MRLVFNLSGKKFGRWTVLRRAYNHPGRTYWKCQCSCGKIKDVVGYTLTHKQTFSCGCLAAEKASVRSKLTSRVHGETIKKTISTEYSAWQSMKTRCYNKNTHYYKYWGGRGIKVCDRWLQSFESFLNDMGRRPTKKHSVDRVDNNGDYSPENCRWATASQQRKNMRSRKVVRLYENTES